VGAQLVACGGSRLHVDWNYTDISRTRDKVMLFLIQRFPMSHLISRMWVSGLNRYAPSDPD
jgi:hypothetical protein